MNHISTPVERFLSANPDFTSYRAAIQEVARQLIRDQASNHIFQRIVRGDGPFFKQIDALVRDNLCHLRAVYICLLVKDFEVNMLPDTHKMALGAIFALTSCKKQAHYLSGQYTNLNSLEAMVNKVLAAVKNRVLSHQEMERQAAIPKANVLNAILIGLLGQVVTEYFRWRSGATNEMLQIKHADLKVLSTKERIFKCFMPQFYHTYKVSFDLLETSKIKIIHIHLAFQRDTGLKMQPSVYYPIGQPKNDQEPGVVIVSYQVHGPSKNETPKYSLLKLMNQGESRRYSTNWQRFREACLKIAAIHPQYPLEKNDSQYGNLTEVDLSQVQYAKNMLLNPHFWQGEAQENFTNISQCPFNILHIFAGTIKTSQLFVKEDMAKYYSIEVKTEIIKKTSRVARKNLVAYTYLQRAQFKQKQHEKFKQKNPLRAKRDMVKMVELPPLIRRTVSEADPITPVDLRVIEQVGKYRIAEITSNPQIIHKLANFTMPNAVRTGLTFDEARIRRSEIKQGVEYDLFLNFKKGLSYSGFVIIQFSSHGQTDILIDYRGRDVEQVTVNEKSVPIRWDGQQIRAKARCNENKITVRFSSSYSTTGRGLTSFTCEGQQFLYSDNEIPNCATIFPVFDQPDIKGRFTVTTIADKTWRIIANERLEKRTLGMQALQWFETHPELLNWKELFGNNENALCEFVQTPKISSYLFAIFAGPYCEIQLASYNRIPVRMYVREKYVELVRTRVSNIFQSITLIGLQTCEKLFGVPYPFSKYDYVCVDEYPWGAMENPGAVTINERFINHTQRSKKDDTILALLLLHELAHMWFGNLVTLAWWDDLALNESFAEFSSFLLLHTMIAENTLPTAIASNIIQPMLFANFKNRSGYDLDQTCVSHGIKCTVKNIVQSECIVDAITYRKGNAVLKQLYMLTGPKVFMTGVQNYFKQFAWRNAELSDLLRHISQAQNQEQVVKSGPNDINNWRKDWLDQPGVNQLQIVAVDLMSHSITVKQTASDGANGKLRFHTLNIAFYSATGALKFIRQQAVIEPKQHTVIRYESGENFDFVLLNHGDHDYVKVVLSEFDFGYFSAMIGGVEEALSVAIVFHSCFDAVRDARTKSETLVSMLLKILKISNCDDILVKLFEVTNTAIDKFVPYSSRGALNSILFDAVLQKLSACTTQQKQLVSALLAQLVSRAASEQKDALLWDWLQDTSTSNHHALSNLKRFDSDLETKYAITYYSKKSKAEKLQTFKKLSERNLKSAICDEFIRCLYVFQAPVHHRNDYWLFWISQQCFKKSSFQVVRAQMQAFNSERLDPGVRAPFVPQFFKSMHRVFQLADSFYAEGWFDTMFPSVDDDPAEIIKLIQHGISHAQNIRLKKKLFVRLDEWNRRRNSAELRKM